MCSSDLAARVVGGALLEIPGAVGRTIGGGIVIL